MTANNQELFKECIINPSKERMSTWTSKDVIEYVSQYSQAIDNYLNSNVKDGFYPATAFVCLILGESNVNHLKLLKEYSNQDSLVDYSLSIDKALKQFQVPFE